MEKIRKTWDVLLTVLCAVGLLFAAGTVFPFIPVFGSVANFVTVGYMHIWLPVCALLFVAALAAGRKKDRGKWLRLADRAMSLLALALSLYVVLSVASEFKANGIDPVFIPEKEDVSDVVTETFVYANSEYGDVELNVYRRDDGVSGKPVMIYIHGGGWIFGSREDHEYYSKVFASHGYVVVSADYDLSSEEVHLAGSTEEQVAEAFAWTANNIWQFGGDPEELFVTGGSAGANLALEVAYRISSGELETASGTALPAVKAVSVNFPVCSLEDFYYNSDLLLGSTARKMALAYTGGDPEHYAELYRSLDPASHVSGDLPATNIFVGANDTLVPPEATYELAELLLSQGYDVQLVRIPYANHMYDMAEGGMGCNAYLESSLDWFDAHR